MQSEPERIISGLADRFNVSITGAHEDYSDDNVDPALAEVRKQVEMANRQIDALQTQLATTAQTTEIEGKLKRLKELHGDAFVEEDVLSYALLKNIDDVETAFKAWRFDEGLSTPAPTAGLDDEVQTLGQIAPGSPTATPTPAKGQLAPPKDAMEAIQRAYSAAGVDMDELLNSV